MENIDTNNWLIIQLNEGKADTVSNRDSTLNRKYPAKERIYINCLIYKLMMDGWLICHNSGTFFLQLHGTSSYVLKSRFTDE